MFMEVDVILETVDIAGQWSLNTESFENDIIKNSTS